MRPFFCCYICICCLKLHQADYQVEEGFFCFFFTSIWWGSTQLQCIYYLRRILISRPLRVFRRFKRCSCIESCGILKYLQLLIPSSVTNLLLGLSRWQGSTLRVVRLPRTSETLKNMFTDRSVFYATCPVGQVKIQSHRHSYRGPDK